MLTLGLIMGFHNVTWICIWVFRADKSAVGTHYIAMCPPDTWPQSLRVPRTGLLRPYGMLSMFRIISESSFLASYQRMII